MITLAEFLHWERTSHDVIDFKRIYVDIAGELVAGLVLSELIYWHLPNRDGASKMRVNRDGQQWVVARRAEWWERIRISPREFDRAVKVLIDAEIIFKEVHYFAGMKALHLRLNEPVFMQKWQWFISNPVQNPHESPETKTQNSDLVGETKLPHGDLVDATKLPDGDLQPRPNHQTVTSITETTVTETTVAAARAKQSPDEHEAKPSAAQEKPINSRRSETSRKPSKKKMPSAGEQLKARIGEHPIYKAYIAAHLDVFVSYPTLTQKRAKEADRVIAALEAEAITPEMVQRRTKLRLEQNSRYDFAWLEDDVDELREAAPAPPVYFFAQPIVDQLTPEERAAAKEDGVRVRAQLAALAAEREAQAL